VADQIIDLQIGRKLSRDICTGVGGRPSFGQHKSLSAVRVSGKFPSRPSSDVLSGSIPLFFIARNRIGFWIARDADGLTGGIFLFRKSARRFVDKICETTGCATMFLADRLELDVKSRGNRVIAWISAALDVATRFIPDYPPPIPTLEKRRKEEWL